MPTTTGCYQLCSGWLRTGASYLQPNWDVFWWEVRGMLSGSVVDPSDSKCAKECEEDLTFIISISAHMDNRWWYNITYPGKDSKPVIHAKGFDDKSPAVAS